MRAVSKLVPAVLVAVLLARGGSARGQDPPPVTEERTRAEALFQEGKRRLDRGEYERACTDLAESNRLDPAIGTMGMLAACHEAQGKLATAWREYRETAARAREASDERETYARGRADALEARVPRVRIVALGAEPALRATLDRQPVEVPTQPLPLDPGRHTVEATIPGSRPWTKVFTLSAGETVDVHIPRFEEPAVRDAAPPPPPAPDGQPVRAAAFVAGGVGIAGLAIGAVFGVLALGKAGELDDARAASCPNACSKAVIRSEYAPRREALDAYATALNVGLLIGTVGLAGGAVLFFASSPPRPASSRPLPLGVRVAAGPGAAMAQLAGGFR